MLGPLKDIYRIIAGYQVAEAMLSLPRQPQVYPLDLHDLGDLLGIEGRYGHSGRNQHISPSVLPEVIDGVLLQPHVDKVGLITPAVVDRN